MTKNFTENFIGHGDVSLAPNMVPELRLDHAESALDVGPLMIVLEEFLSIEGEIVKHLFPEPADAPL